MGNVKHTLDHWRIGWTKQNIGGAKGGKK